MQEVSIAVPFWITKEPEMTTICAIFPGSRVVEFKDGFAGEIPEPVVSTPPAPKEDWED